MPTLLISKVTSRKHGATHSPIFSNDGTKVAWAELAEDRYESDCAVLVVYGLKDESPPASVYFSEDDRYLRFTAGTEARVKVFVLPVPASKPNSNKKLPSPFKPTSEHTTSAIQPLPGGRFLYSQSSFTKPNDVHDLQAQSSRVSQLTRVTKEELNGKSLDAREEFYFDGAEMKSQGWVLKPKGYSKNTGEWTPLSLIRGGPQGVWEDGSSTRQNPNVFARLGASSLLSPVWFDYFWTRDRAVAAGAEYGGYATKYFFASIPRDHDKDVPSWIQRNPGLDSELTHCAMRSDSQYNEYSTDELFFNHEFGGQPWKNNTRELTKKFSSSNHAHKWSTSELIVQGSKGYRLPKAVGIAAFHASRRQGVPSRLAIFPDENYWVLTHGNKWHYGIRHWLNQFVGKDNASQKCTPNSESRSFSKTKDLDGEVADPLSKLRDFSCLFPVPVNAPHDCSIAIGRYLLPQLSRCTHMNPSLSLGPSLRNCFCRSVCVPHVVPRRVLS
ncbi:hypothetical protein BDM02DRAFT_3186014 [Thelephora ganbajun]|uniref:Uncharacterized protein n=1 Tax=Thelephora ganbajun TaxID=370292 RepID=A0ACB6ZKY2_THEGA|nr:hypothetical protein BDM02DRAFT_3186014 [Thelephora ganbajun]